MALEMERSTNIGLNLEKAYLRIDNLSGNKTEQMMTIGVYVNASACDSGKEAVEFLQRGFSPSVEAEAPNFIKQGYEHLKTLPEFSAAMDA